jgi:hypothetical protein
VQVVRLADGLLQAVGEGEHAAGGAVVGDDHHELVARAAADEIGVTDGLAQALAHLPQHRVADALTERLVDASEAVERDDDDGEAELQHGRALDAAHGLLEQRGAIGQTRDGVERDAPLARGLLALRRSRRGRRRRRRGWRRRRGRRGRGRMHERRSAEGADATGGLVVARLVRSVGARLGRELVLEQLADVVERREAIVVLRAGAHVGEHEETELVLLGVEERRAEGPRHAGRAREGHELGGRARARGRVPRLARVELQPGRRQRHLRDLARLLEPHDALEQRGLVAIEPEQRGERCFEHARGDAHEACGERCVGQAGHRRARIAFPRVWPARFCRGV